MKHLLIIFSLLLTSVSWSKDINFYDLVVIDGLYYKKFTDKPFTGNVTGIVQSKMKNGKWVGVFKRYYKNGQLESKGNFKDDKKEGEWLHYRSNGKLWRKYYYKEGKKDGKWTWYDTYGNLVRTELY